MLQRATTGASGSGGGTWWNEAIPANSSVTINNVNNGMFYIKSSFTDIEVCAIENGAVVEKIDGFLCTFNYNNGNLTIAMNGYAASGLHRGYYS